MEEVKCSLVGFPSGLLRRSLEGSAQGSDASRTNVEADGKLGDIASAAFRSCCAHLPFHPTEQLLLQRALPLGEQYQFLLRTAQDAAVGRVEGLYPAAIASGIQKILTNYAEAVKAIDTPSALAALPSTYALTFALLQDIVKHQRQVGECLPLLDQFLHNQEVPAIFRSFLGESVWLALLFTIAHYVAHGVVLHARPDFFIALRLKTAKTGSPSVAVDRGTDSSSSGGAGERREDEEEEHIFYADRLPSGISTELGLRIFAAGKERRVLLRDTEMQGGRDYLEQLALGSQDEAANAVFHSLFKAELCRGGVLATQDLMARVEAASTLWSKALWMKVGNVTSLRLHLAALRSMFLCHRGDVWYTFVERMLPLLTSLSPLHSHEPPGARRVLPATVPLSHPSSLDRGGETGSEEDQVTRTATAPNAAAFASRCASLQRAVSDAFLFAMSVSALRDSAVFDTFVMQVEPSGVQQAEANLRTSTPSRTGDSQQGSSVTASSTEDMARYLLLLVRSFSLQFLPPHGLTLIVSSKALQYYQRLFGFHLALRFSLEALAAMRSLFTEALAVTNKKPSADLRRAFALLQRLQFIGSTIGYYMQVDVISVCAAELEEQLASSSCTSVDYAKRLHDQFVWNVAEATFLTAGSEVLSRACDSFNVCATTLYRLCTRYRVAYWAVEGVNETPVEVRVTLTALEARVQQDVVAVFTGYLSMGGRPWERALWSRLNFNGFFSQYRTRPAIPVALGSAISSAAAAAAGEASHGETTQVGQTRARSTSRSPRRRGGTPTSRRRHAT